MVQEHVTINSRLGILEKHGRYLNNLVRRMDSTVKDFLKESINLQAIKETKVDKKINDVLDRLVNLEEKIGGVEKHGE